MIAKKCQEYIPKIRIIRMPSPRALIINVRNYSRPTGASTVPTLLSKALGCEFYRFRGCEYTHEYTAVNKKFCVWPLADFMIIQLLSDWHADMRTSVFSGQEMQINKAESEIQKKNWRTPPLMMWGNWFLWAVSLGYLCNSLARNTLDLFMAKSHTSGPWEVLRHL